MDIVGRVIHAITVTHPTHPITVHFPIALSCAALLFVLLAHWRRSAALEHAAFANIVLACLGAVAAGITGYVDNARNYGGEAPYASTKIALGIVLFLVTGAVVLARQRDPQLLFDGRRWAYVAGYAIAAALALTLGFLGGAILYGF